jgi:hypothetical protein
VDAPLHDSRSTERGYRSSPTRKAALSNPSTVSSDSPSMGVPRGGPDPYMKR